MPGPSKNYEEVATEQTNITPTVVAAADSPYTTQGESRIAVDTTNGAVTVTLASADAVDGRLVKIADHGLNAGTNPITVEVEGANGEVINPGGAASKTIGLTGGYLELENIGGNWYSDRNAEREAHAADDATHNTSYTDPGGNQYTGVVGALANAGYSQGDFLPLLSIGGDNTDASTTSSSYTNVLQSAIETRVLWDAYFPPGVTSSAVFHCGANANGDQIDVRVQNLNDGETVVEELGTTGTVVTKVNIGPTNYTPTTTASQTLWRVQVRNADNATSVDIEDPYLLLGTTL